MKAPASATASLGPGDDIGHLATENAIPQRKIKEWLKKNRICLHHSGSYNVQNVRRKLHELHHSGGAQALRDEH